MFIHSLRFYTVLPILLIAILLNTYIYAFWIPKLERFSENTARASIQHALNSMTTPLVPFLIENELSNIYSTLDYALKENLNWEHLKLINQTGSHLYPLSSMEVPLGEYREVFTADVKTELGSLGTLSLTYNFENLREAIHKKITNLFILVCLLTLALSIITVMLMEIILLRPIKRITNMALKMASNDYASHLPKTHTKELNDLSEVFMHMRHSIESAQQKMQQSVDDAKASNEAKSDFLANMSHELRTPMNGVLGIAEMLKDTPLSEEQDSFTAQIQKSAEQLLVILNDILDFSKIEAQALELEHIPYHVSSTFHDVLNMLYPLAKEKGLELTLHLSDEVPEFLMGDPGRVRQVIINLVGNAIKFTLSGSISIDVHLDESTHIVVSVKDTGVGIAEAKLNHIFGKFTQADSSNSRKFGGTGLGLAITQSLIQLMEGDISVTSIEGMGSTFKFSIPCILPTEEDIQKFKERENPYLQLDLEHDYNRVPVQDVCLLLVEDDPVNQNVARRLLSKIGIKHIDVANHGQEAVDMFMPELYNFILMDCQMPIMDGFEATKNIREREFDTDTHLPIVALTANAMVGDREKCLAAGMDEYLSKPIKLNKMIHTLSRWIIFNEEVPEVQNDNVLNHSNAPVDIEHISMFTDGDTEQEKELFALFLQTGEECLQKLKESTVEGKENEWKTFAHRMKGASANLGANMLSEFALDAELGADAPASKKEIMLEDIEQKFQEVTHFLKEYLSQKN